MRQAAGTNSCRFDGEEMTWVKTIQAAGRITNTIFLFSAPVLGEGKKKKNCRGFLFRAVDRQHAFRDDIRGAALRSR